MEATTITVEGSAAKRKGPRGGVRFGPRLAQILSTQRGYKNKLAAAVGVYPSTIHRLAQGILGCDPAIADSIAEYVGEPLSSLQSL
jgi:hypothetical protein